MIKTVLIDMMMMMMMSREYPKVLIFTLHHNAAPTAEMAISLLLAAAKQVLKFRQGL